MRLQVLEEPNLLPGAPQPNIFDLWYNPARPFLTLGRRVDNDIVIADSSVSRVHLEIQVREDGVIIRDLGSSNGTYVDDKPLEDQVPMLVRPGSKIQVGNVVLLLEATAGSPVSGFPYARQPGEAIMSGVQAAGGMAGGFDNNLGESFEFPEYYRNELIDGEMAPLLRRTDHSELPPPEHMEKISQTRLKPLPSRKRGWNLWVYLLILLSIALLIGLVVFLALLMPGSGEDTNRSATMPAGIFFSPSNGDSALGINLSHPSKYQRVEGEPQRIVFRSPDSQVLSLVVERAPSRNLPDTKATPENALKNYLENLKKGFEEVRVQSAPTPVSLKDGTPAYLAKVVYNGNENGTRVQDYTILATTFQCNNALYLVFVGEEDRNLQGGVQQDLNAVIANVTCR